MDAQAFGQCSRPSYLQLPEELRDLSAVQLLAGLPVGIDHFVHSHVLGCGQRSRLRLHSPCLLPCPSSLPPNSSMTELQVTGITQNWPSPLQSAGLSGSHRNTHSSRPLLTGSLLYHTGNPSWAGCRQVPCRPAQGQAGIWLRVL